MKRLLLAALLSLSSLAPASAAPPADEAIFVEGSRYNAVLSASRGDWRLLPLTGSEVRLRLAEACRAFWADKQMDVVGHQTPCIQLDVKDLFQLPDI